MQKKIKFAIVALFAIVSFNFNVKKEKIANTQNLISIVNPSQQMNPGFVSIRYDVGLTPQEKLAVRNCLSAKYGVIFVQQQTQFSSPAGDAELWSVLIPERHGKTDKWEGQGEDSGDDSLPVGGKRVCGSYVSFTIL